MGERSDAGGRSVARCARCRRTGGAGYRAEGWWTDETLGEMVAAGLGRMGDVGLPGPLGGAPVAGHLRRRRPVGPGAGRRRWRADGVGPGDVVLFQLPNWVEAGITFWAAAYLGAVVVPVVHFYGRQGGRLHPGGHVTRRWW